MEVPIISISSSQDEKQVKATECVSSVRSRDEEYRMLADLNGFENLKALIEGEAMMKMNKRKRQRKIRKKEGVMGRSEEENRRDAELRMIVDLNGFKNLKALILMVADLTGFENLKGFIEGEEGKRHRAVPSSEKEIRRESEFRMLADLTGFDNLKALMEGEALMKRKQRKKKKKKKNGDI